jgi:aminoacrylate peracid reductase
VVLYPGDAAAQTRHILGMIAITLQAAGVNLGDVVMNHIFLKDMADYAAFNAVYAEHFPGAKPARYCIRADLVKPECLVEIASVAHRGGGRPVTLTTLCGLYHEEHGPRRANR